MSSMAERGRGFTLIEMLVVITVIAILASLVTPMVFRNVGDAKVSAARAQVEVFGLALDAYRRGPYLKKAVPLDPYGRPYVYRSPGDSNPDSYDLLTLGRDGTLGGNGEDADVTSWGGPAR